MFKIRANKLTWSYFILAVKTKRILHTLTRLPKIRILHNNTYKQRGHMMTGTHDDGRGLGGGCVVYVHVWETHDRVLFVSQGGARRTPAVLMGVQVWGWHHAGSSSRTVYDLSFYCVFATNGRTGTTGRCCGSAETRDRSAERSEHCAERSEHCAERSEHCAERISDHRDLLWIICRATSSLLYARRNSP